MISRRAFLSLPVALPFLRPPSRTPGEHHFQFDHVIGTSLDLVVWTPRSQDAERANLVVMDEIVRLAALLDTRDADSDISCLERTPSHVPSNDVAVVLDAYETWERRTGGVLGVRPAGAGSRLNVDALGKAYILDRAAAAVRRAVPEVDGLLLNIGGDIVVWGPPREIAIVDPACPYDNARPLMRVRIEDGAIATSGTYARGSHLLDARTGAPTAQAVSATVVARDAVTANALATTLSITGDALPLVEGTAGAAAVTVDTQGIVRRSTRFGALERPVRVQRTAPTAWPADFQVTMTLVLTEGVPDADAFGSQGFGRRRGGRDRGGARRPYIAVWAENEAGALVRIIAFWGNKPRYYDELAAFWSATRRDENLLYSAARATRPPGTYRLAWDGLDDRGRPVPEGAYRITVESNQEHGSYGKKTGVITCGRQPASATVASTANTETVTLQYGPPPGRV